jgi:hypothetical protein
MSDENERSVASAGSVAGGNDLIDRLSDLSGDVGRWGGKTIGEAIAEIERLREAIRRLADQDATLSVQGGNVIVEMDAAREMPMPSDPFCVESGPFLGRIIGIEGIASLRLTDAEREALSAAIATAQDAVDKKLLGWEADEATASTLRSMLERLGGEQ